MIPYGTWGMSKVTSTSSFNALLPFITGFLYRIDWKDIQTGISTYDWTYFDGQLNYSFNAGIPVGLELFTGKGAPLSGTSNWMAPFVTNFTNTAGTWPYYLDPNYAPYWYAFTDAVIDHMATYPQWKKDLILFWESAEGTTGDPGPYQGTVPLAYQIDESSGAEWDQFKRPYWTHLANKLASTLPECQPMINVGNNGQNWQWCEDNISYYWGKAGNFSHNYSVVDEGNFSNRLATFRDSLTDENRIRGEFENTDSQPFWQQSTKQNFFTLLASCLHASLDIVNISYATHSTNGYTSYPYDFFKRYAGVRKAQDTDSAFIMLRDEIDILDTVRFPETGPGSYGVVVTQNVTDFNNKISAINSSVCVPPNYDNCRSPQEVISDTTNLYLTPCTSGCTGDYKYINPTRIANIRAAFPTAGYRTITISQQMDSYNGDYSARSIPNNYSKFITQYSPNTTSEGVWRLGNTNQYFGRYSRQFKISSNQGEMFFTTDADLTVEGNNSVEISVTYFDVGTGFWSLNCATCKGKTEIGVKQNTNTNTWKTVTFTTDYYLGDKSLPNGSDFTLRYHSGLNTQFTLIEFKVL